ncbi:DNA polymerase III subunit delta' [Mesomycoplasma hyopneumoniae]|uniref:DNA polymerase III delta subunit n=1 Tax=Mesomycoplasma hyopneumoniae (strain 7448) TaxID=262722 RepID=Q4A8A5_MESH7|nr:DNA polymerase III subunit delta' [Mesomycoplasma hyopneumoniae]AAZ53634.2 DNA polymerase III delta subunit [Mesomycoplasma hyopneumoniae 7448]
MQADQNNWSSFLYNLDKNGKIPHAILLISNYPNLLDSKINEFLEIFEHKYEIFLYDIFDKNLSKQEFLEDINKLYFSTFADSQSKIFILKNIEKTHISLLNSLLKILEDPPKSTYFLLIAKSQNLVIPTIVSRCQVFWFTEFDRQKDLKKKLDQWKETPYNSVYAKIFSNFETAITSIAKISENDLVKFESLFNNLAKKKFEFLIFLNNILTKENALILVKMLVFYSKSIFLNKPKKNSKNSKKGTFMPENFKKITKVMQSSHKFLTTLDQNENFNVQKSAFLVRLNIIL